jgi:hypothetical protein
MLPRTSWKIILKLRIVVICTEVNPITLVGNTFYMNRERIQLVLTVVLVTQCGEQSGKICVFRC